MFKFHGYSGPCPKIADVRRLEMPQALRELANKMEAKMAEAN